MNDPMSYYQELEAHRSADPLGAARTRDAEGAVPAEVRAEFPNIAAEIKAKYHEYASPIPPAIDGCAVLDLGCGTGRDTYIASKLVGEDGTVVGFDPSTAALDVARKYQDREAAQFGYAKSNVEFIGGTFEDLSAIPNGSIDVVFSNCVLNKARDKQKVLDEIWRVLKDGGELFFTDVFTDHRIPVELADDMDLRAARLSGALYIEDFRRMTQRAGWANYRYFSRRKTPMSDAEAARLNGYAFATITIRAVKNPALMDDICENYGETLTYKGDIPGYEDGFRMDEDIFFPTGKKCPVCGICTAIFGSSHYKDHFDITGDRTHHIGDMHGDKLIKTAEEYSGVKDEDEIEVTPSCC